MSMFQEVGGEGRWGGGLDDMGGIVTEEGGLEWIPNELVLYGGREGGKECLAFSRGSMGCDALERRSGFVSLRGRMRDTGGRDAECSLWSKLGPSVYGRWHCFV